MKETPEAHREIEHEIEQAHLEHRELPLGYEDPHKAALEDNPEQAEKLTLAVILSAIFLGTSFTGPIIFGFILVTPILVQLGEKLGGANISFWIPSGWGAAAAVGFSIAGRLSDIFGRRYVILFGQALTIIGGIVACTAKTMNSLIAGEVILGASIGTISVAYAGLSEILPNKYRGMGLAWTEFNLSSWAIGGTLLANAMLTKASWRVMFYIAIGYGAFSLIGTACVYFPPSHPRPDGKTKWQEFMELDFLGAALFVSGLAVFLYGLNSGGNTYPWSAAGTLAPLILGLIVFLGSFIYDFFIPKDPLFPWYLFKNFREFSSLLTLVFVAGMVFFAASALNAETILYLHSSDNIKIGIYSLPSGAGQIVGGVLIPALVHYIKHVQFQLTFAVFMQTLFFGLAALITPTNINWLMACQFLAMLPFGWITLNCYTTASLHVPQRDLGVAIGLIGTFRSLGGSIGSVIFTSIFTQVGAKSITTRVGEAVAAANLPADLTPGLVAATRLTILGVPGQAAQFPTVPASVYAACVSASRYGYAYGFRITWLASIPFGVIAVLCAISVKDPSKYFTNHVEIHLERDIGGKQREGKVFKEEHDEETHEATSAAEEKQLEAGTQV
ncbi:putative major facilitator superfamily transporter [Hyaloscypha variabilis F]|uniref:Putative major facilitator superfamily transporter n=1 Tax=Hyaloscypha variabilis (strain UAMH 11265 / GT02V1 / F) TaxID=1149755 RepID=A0A2J6RBR0_HYAVF|nr:putative major facilitator superfamily transporter [Hyaloscypha variabilis F]